MNPLALLTLLFFLSGAAGLFYESIWARYLGLFVGHDAYGQITVLVIFLGGMAIGAWVVSRQANRILAPLVAYAIVELVIALLGLVFHRVYLGTTGWAYDYLYPTLAGSWGLSIAKWSLAGLLILPQSVLLGATFPLMTAGALRLGQEPAGRLLGQLYFANSLGAAAGVLVAGFYLIARVGLPGTLSSAAVLNLFVGLATLAVAARTRTRRRDTSAPEAPGVEPLKTPADTGLRRFLLTVSFGTAVASFLYEIGWIRMLSLVLGSATHSFELMLSAFILGLALGSWWIRSRADRLAEPLRSLGVIQWAMGGLALATLPLYTASFGWMSTLLQTFAPTDSGYIGYTVSRYAICLAVMLPATFCAGMTLPLITRVLLRRGDGERAIGAVYACNTLGSILGVMAAALVLLPYIGLKGTVMLGAALDMALGVALVGRGPAGGRLRVGLAAATVAALLAGAVLVDLRKGVLASGVFRRGAPPVPDSTVVYYRDGRTATVSAVQLPDVSMTHLATNGKPDASLTAEWFVPCHNVTSRVPLRSDASTQTLAALIAMAHAPAARTAAVIGHGSGISSHHLLANPSLTRLATIEIEPRMVDGSRIFYPINRRVFDDPRSDRIVDDAKSYFAATNARYDLILSEPSNPWVSGVSGLFTTEFYRAVKRHLAEGAVFAQWLHLYELDDELALGVLSALHRNFPAYEIFLTTESDILVIATTGDRLPAPDWSVVRLPEIERDLCRFVPFTPTSLEATRLGGRALFTPLLDSLVPPNSDFHPLLDLGAEKRRFLHTSADGLKGLASDRFSLAGLLEGRRFPLVDDPSLPVTTIPRIEANSIAAQVRADRAGTVLDRSQAADASGAVFDFRRWQQTLRAPDAPSSWRTWVRLFEETERTVSGGSQGVADEEFYRSVHRYLERHRAPAPVRSVVDFYHGLATYDFAKVAYATDRLLPEFRRGRRWITGDELRDGAVVARLGLKDITAARRLFVQLAPLSVRPPNSFQSLLLQSHIARAEAEASRR